MSSDRPDSFLIKRADAAKLLSVSVRQIEILKKQGRLPYVKFGYKCVRYRLSDIQVLIEKSVVGKKRGQDARN